MTLAGKGRQYDDQRAQAGQDQCQPASAAADIRTVVTPQCTGKGQEPDQHGEIDMDHERGTEEILPGYDFLEERGTRQYDQNGEQSTDNQCG